MKKCSHRPIRDYQKYDDTDIRYYGLLYKDGRARVDVKRLIKTMYVEDHILEVMNRPRKTAYFIPARIKTEDYMTNLFRQTISQQKLYWDDELKRVIEKIVTPNEAADEARTGYYMQTGILDFDECQTHAFWTGLQREGEYLKVIYYLYAQFVHQLASAIEAITLKVMVLNGYKNDTFNRNEFNSFIQGYIKGQNKDTIENTLESLSNYPVYDKLYLVWNFLKHNSISIYTKIKAKYPKLLIPDKAYENGDPALTHIILSDQLIEEFLNNLHLFFDDLCQKVFGENTQEALWNSDDSIKFMVQSYIQSQTNPLGIPFGI